MDQPFLRRGKWLLVFLCLIIKAESAQDIQIDIQVPETEAPPQHNITQPPPPPHQQPPPQYPPQPPSQYTWQLQPPQAPPKVESAPVLGDHSGQKTCRYDYDCGLDRNVYCDVSDWDCEFRGLCTCETVPATCIKHSDCPQAHFCDTSDYMCMSTVSFAQYLGPQVALAPQYTKCKCKRNSGTSEICKHHHDCTQGFICIKGYCKAGCINDRDCSRELGYFCHGENCADTLTCRCLNHVPLTSINTRGRSAVTHTTRVQHPGPTNTMMTPCQYDSDCPNVEDRCISWNQKGGTEPCHIKVTSKTVMTMMFMPPMCRCQTRQPGNCEKVEDCPVGMVCDLPMTMQMYKYYPQMLPTLSGYKTCQFVSPYAQMMEQYQKQAKKSKKGNSKKPKPKGDPKKPAPKEIPKGKPPVKPEA